MVNKDNTAHLHLMMDSFRKIREYIDTMSQDEFFRDSKTQSAVIMQLQVVGELSKRILDDTKNEIDIPWKEIIGMRDIVSHDYFNLDIKTVWDTAMKSVPEVELEIGKYLKISGTLN
jgi:uncharacterized protein with HEPN domain